MFRFRRVLGKRRQRIESELDAELRDHVERQVTDYIASGMTPAEARRRARLVFGGAEQVKEDCRDVDSWRRVEMTWGDLKQAVRSLGRSPGFTMLAIALLAVGIGSNLAVFSVIDPLLLRPLDVDNPQEIVEISSLDEAGDDQRLFSKIMDPLRREPMFQGLCAWDQPPRPTEIDGVLRSMRTLAMSGDCFSTIGIRTQLGRPFTMRDDDMRAQRVAVLTDSLWRSAFASSPDVLGGEIIVAGSVFTIIGVAEPRFTGFTRGRPAELIVPLAQRPWPGGNAPSGPGPFYFWTVVLGRLQPTVSLQQAQARLSAIERRLLEEHAPRNPEQRRDHVNRKLVVRSSEEGIETGTNSWLMGRFGEPLYAIWGILSLVLLVGCVNLAILFLGRGLARQREMAIRLALGASRVSVVRLLALESVPLVLVGTALGLMLARGINHVVAGQAQELMIVLSSASLNPGLDVRTALFLLGLMTFVAALLAVVPVWQASRLADGSTLKESGRGVIGSSTRTQKILLGVQVALALALVSGSGLFTASLRALSNVDLGMRIQGVSVVTLASVPGVTAPKDPVPYYRDLLRQLEAVPGVASASVIDFAPFWTRGWREPVTTVERGFGGGGDLRAEVVTATNEVFETLGVPIVAGEGFRPESGGSGSERTAIVSESLARLLGGDRLVGRRIHVGESKSDEPLRVVGIASDVRQYPLAAGARRVYVNLWQAPDIWSPYLLVKARRGASLAPGEIRRTVASFGQHFVEDYRTLDQSKARALIENRWLANVSTGVGALALILAATGLFGLLAYHVASRTSEIGIRMALGAGRRQIHWHVLRQLLPVMLAGTLGGVALTLLLGKVIAGLLYGVSVHEPRLLGLAVAALMATAVLAAVIPARKAASVDPVVALRHE